MFRRRKKSVVDVSKKGEECVCGGKGLQMGSPVGGLLWTARKELVASVKSSRALQLPIFPPEPSSSDSFGAVG